jgi:hypothetical protein
LSTSAVIAFALVVSAGILMPDKKIFLASHSYKGYSTGNDEQADQFSFRFCYSSSGYAEA